MSYIYSDVGLNTIFVGSYLPFILILLTVNSTFGQSGKRSTQNEISRADSINGIFIPKDIHESLDQIDQFLNDSIKSVIKSWTEEEFIQETHHGLGMWVRNNWVLWGGSRLASYFYKYNINHPDNMSTIILRSYHRRLTEKDLILEEQINGYNQRIKDSENKK